MKKETFYITTTLPYVNAEAHIGHALEFIQADALARYHRLCGFDVIFNTGTDEHGLKIYRKAVENNESPQEYCDRYAAKFQALKEVFNLSYTNFIRTTDESHKAAAQEFWRVCEKNGDIYKKKYAVKYCVGCEMEKTDSELVEDRCPIHPKNEIEFIEEENYFFRWSRYQNALLKHYEAHPDFVVPSNRLTEIRNFVSSGLQDFSISRLKEKMPWGVPVPGDDTQVMYVWFDALVNYISTLGWPYGDLYAHYWPGIQLAGKDNLRQQSAMWQGMLLSAGLPLSKQIFIHGHITKDGQKMSKSIGNVVNPLELVEKYGVDGVRFFLLGAISSYDDGDFTYERFEEYYTGNLVNGVGNLTSRILTMLEKYTEGKVPVGGSATPLFAVPNFWQRYRNCFHAYRFDEAIALIMSLVAACDQKISEEKPWEKAKLGEDISGFLFDLSETLRHIGLALLPIIPNTAEKILERLGTTLSHFENLEEETVWGKLQPGTLVQKGDILFPRLIK